MATMTGLHKPTLGFIAKKLDISIATVSRALQNHPAITEETKSRVLKKAKEVGYTPNLAARYLVSKRGLRIAVNTPREISSVYDLVRQGIRDEAKPLEGIGLKLVDYTFPHLGKGQRKAFEQALADEVDGIIIVPGNPEILKAGFAQARKQKVPLVCLLTESPLAGKISTVAVNAASCGALAGELMSRLLPSKCSVAVTLGDLKVTDHKEKFESFQRTVQMQSAGIRVYRAIENHESTTEAYEKTLTFLKKHPELKGLYISTGNGIPILQAIEDARMIGKINILGTNLYNEVIHRIRKGDVLGTFYERPYSHGRIALRLLYEYLTAGTAPPSRIALEPLLVMRGNLDSFVREEEMLQLLPQK
jgi:LacI family transcriptional regulator